MPAHWQSLFALFQFIPFNTCKTETTTECSAWCVGIPQRQLYVPTRRFYHQERLERQKQEQLEAIRREEWEHKNKRQELARRKKDLDERCVWGAANEEGQTQACALGMRCFFFCPTNDSLRQVRGAAMRRCQPLGERGRGRRRDSIRQSLPKGPWVWAQRRHAAARFTWRAAEVEVWGGGQGHKREGVGGR